MKIKMYKQTKKKKLLFRELPLEYYTPHANIILNKSKFLEQIDCLNSTNTLPAIKKDIFLIKNVLSDPDTDREGLLNIDKNGETIILDKKTLLKEFSQIESSQTLERAKYYITRLKKGVEKIKTTKINDINLYRWKEYEDILTDSLWILDKRDSSGAHFGWYWGNFIPQIPHQLMLRYTKKGEWVLDPFVGSGTTLIECRRLGRNGIGIELNPEIAEKARNMVEKEPNLYNVITRISEGDSSAINFQEILKEANLKKFQLLIMHPPYHDIIKFSDDERDLSNASTVETFLKMFGEVLDNTHQVLEKNRYFGLVIGDKYSQGEWIPLGFLTMQEVLKRKFILKSIIVKNFEQTRGKRNQKELWRYRALVGGFYIFKHEYIMVFKKVGS